MKDHDLLVRIDERVCTIHVLLESHAERLDDHEDDIVSLKSSRSWGKGLLAACGTIIAVVGGFIFRS